MFRYKKTSFHEMTGISRALHIGGMVLAGITFACVMAFVFGLVVQWIWNWLMPGLFGLSEISYWQAFGMIILGRIIFGGIGHNNHSHSRKKYEQADRGRETGKTFRGDAEGLSDYYTRFWDEEGREAFENYLKNMEEK